ncbi:uncharacterized protein BYT42DRAFT_618441 [Radiomyces spectabilis]|uniref:uncharacterized protein n=1 Tax=Radiomyces spectabilis TaxID=64574 RepID=UPI0022201987|nr:uncharacterized protein BYT42DRAFT_618441 [Radiomyces spectabilis]KAI8365996.1 hypothetical protein BYT42DRAFT_618441 [Radiomyces spectabilis]
MAAVLHQPSKACTSASCCSPSRLWRSIQTMVTTDAKNEFSRLCHDRPTHVLQVLLSSRIPNDPSQYPASHKYRVIQFDSAVRTDAVRKFGKSVTDLNAVQLALFQRRETMACLILSFIRQHATPPELKTFVNHVWGYRNTSLHLACFWGMPRLVRLLLACGADASIRNSRQFGPQQCGTNPECLTLLQRHLKPLPPTAPTTAPKTTEKHRPTVLKLVNDNNTAPLHLIKDQRTNTKVEKKMPEKINPNRGSLDNSSNTDITLLDTATTSPRSDNDHAVEEPKRLLKRPSLLLKKAVNKVAEHALTMPYPDPTPMTATDMRLSEEYFTAMQTHTLKKRPSITREEGESFPYLVSPPPTPVRATLSSMSFSSSTSSSSSFSSFSSIDDPTGKHGNRADDLCWTPPPPSPHSDDEPLYGTTWHQLAEPRFTPPTTPPSPVPLRPACFPTMRIKVKTVRQVRFDPQIVLIDACVRGDLVEISQLISNASTTMGLTGTQNRSLLHLALMHGQEEVAKYLVTQANIDVNHQDNDGWTALHYAAALGLWRSVEFLASLHDIDLHARTNHGLLIQDCPESDMDQRRCRLMIERAIRRHAKVKSTCT